MQDQQEAALQALQAEHAAEKLKADEQYAQSQQELRGKEEQLQQTNTQLVTVSHQLQQRNDKVQHLEGQLFSIQQGADALAKQLQAKEQQWAADKVSRAVGCGLCGVSQPPVEG